MGTGKVVRIETGASDERRHFLGIFFYLGILLTLFSLHGAFIFNEDLLTYRQVIALVNAFTLSNIVVLGKKLRLGATTNDAPVAPPP
jgi:hypothetical protein